MKGWILLSAGGTGGHLFPAEALAHVLKDRGWRICLVTDRRAERFADRFPADEIAVVTSATISGRNPLALFDAGWKIWQGVRQSNRLIQRIRPAAAVGFGGYPTLPPIWAASRRGVPTLIHEQNAVMGRANRALASRVSRIAGGFLKAEGTHAGRTIETGNPVRPDVLEAAAHPYEAPSEAGPFRLLVFGGSQGARYFAEVVPDAVARLAPQLRARLEISLQAREDDAAAAREALAGLGVTATVAPFFTDMAARIRDAHLVVSRSGASTVSEIAAIGRPAVLVPYPHALDHDQAANAAALAEAGGAQVWRQGDLDGAALAEIIRTWSADPQRLSAMAKAARSVGRPNAAVLLADAVEAIASVMPGGQANKGDTP